MGRSELRDVIGRLLVDSVLESAGPISPRVRSIPADAIVDAADLHRVSPAVFRRLRSFDGIADDCMRLLSIRRHEQLARHLTMMQDLKYVAQALDAANVPWVVVKGPALAELIWPSPGMRQYSDLDLIVDRRHFETALAALQDANISLIDRNWPLLASTMRAEVALRGRHGTPVDLHWDYAVPVSLRRAFATDVPGMIARASRRTIGDVPVPVPDPVDTVLHLVFHTAQAGANLLVWLADVHHAAAREGFDWAEFGRRAAGARFDVPAALVVARVDRVLGFEVRPPEPILKPSRGPWGRLAEWRDSRTPFPGLPGDPHLGGTMYSSARDGLVRTLATSLRSYRDARRIEAAAVDGPGERELRIDVPDARARDRYLSTVRWAEEP